MQHLLRSIVVALGLLQFAIPARSAEPPDPPPPGYALLYRGGICVADGSGNCIGGDAMAEAGIGQAIGYMKTSPDLGTVAVYRGTCYSDGSGDCVGWGLILEVNGTPVGYLATSAPDPQSESAPFTQSGGLLLQNLGGAASAYLWFTVFPPPAIASLSPSSGPSARRLPSAAPISALPRGQAPSPSTGLRPFPILGAKALSSCPFPQELQPVPSW